MGKGKGKKIRLGIWGLGRGAGFVQTCNKIGMDVVAGCDFNEHMRVRFQEANPDAFVTDRQGEFLDFDMDAVLLATYCPDHCGDAIAALEAGKHVLSEVTSFHTMAEGVRLVETVEKTGLVYNLAENYPFTRPNMYLAQKYEEGLFGELEYAEYEYVHNCMSLAYTYIDGVPITPGDQVHSWRSWLNFHYYCTHSLGPVMVITGTRPTRVVALPGQQTLPGYLQEAPQAKGGIAPSLINMSNGAVVRNLMGATTNDSHIQRLWGTRGSAEIIGGRLYLRLGSGGESPKMLVEPDWPSHGRLAAKTGHGGGDFWLPYYFARQIREGTPAPFEVYAAADCTSAGILAYRSSLEGGKPYAVPDFRDRRQRGKWRCDEWAQQRYDHKNGCFPKGADRRITGKFSATVKDLIVHVRTYRAYVDWLAVSDELADKSSLIKLLDDLITSYPDLEATYRAARKIVAAYPRSDGAKVLREMLELGDHEHVLAPGFLTRLKRKRTGLRKKWG